MYSCTVKQLSSYTVIQLYSCTVVQLYSYTVIHSVVQVYRPLILQPDFWPSRPEAFHAPETLFTSAKNACRVEGLWFRPSLGLNLALAFRFKS